MKICPFDEPYYKNNTNNQMLFGDHNMGFYEHERHMAVCLLKELYELFVYDSQLPKHNPPKTQ